MTRFFNPFRLEPRRLHAEDMQLILRSIEVMSASLDRLTASVGRVVTDVANELRNHPAAQNDDGALNALADKLDQASSDIEAAAAPAPTDTGATDGSAGGDASGQPAA